MAFMMFMISRFMISEVQPPHLCKQQPSHQTRDAYSVLVKCRPIIADVGQTVSQHRVSRDSCPQKTGICCYVVSLVINTRRVPGCSQQGHRHFEKEHRCSEKACKCSQQMHRFSRQMRFQQIGPLYMLTLRALSKEI